MFLLVLYNMHIPTPNFFRSKIYGKRKSLRNKSQGVKIFFVKWTLKHLFFLSHLSIYFRLFFFHPDYTVGSGIFCLSESPDQRFHARGLYRRSGLSVSNYIRFRSPCPEDLFAVLVGVHKAGAITVLYRVATFIFPFVVGGVLILISKLVHRQR